MPEFTSNHGKVMLGLKDLVKSLAPEDITDREVEVRETWLHNGSPFRGVTIYDAGERWAAGTIGTQDIGYVCGIVFVRDRSDDAALDNDQIQRWHQIVRKELDQKRLSVTIVDETAPREHVCTIMGGGENPDPKNKFDRYTIRRLTVAVWLRETA